MSETEVTFEKKNINDSLLQSILFNIRENNTIIKDPDLRTHVIVENLMLREYFHDPDLSYSECRKLIQPMCPDYHLTDLYIKERAISLGVNERKERRFLAEWAHNLTGKIYEGMTGNHDLLNDAIRQLKKPYSKSLSKVHPVQHRMILIGLFETVPGLRRSEERGILLQFGKPYSIRCLNKIINSAIFDTSSTEEKLRISGDEDVEQLRRELFIARKELSDYKDLTEAADAEFEDRLTALKDGEIASFFSQLTDQKYGYLIDSIFTQSQIFRELKKNGTEIPYQIEGVSVILGNMIQFLRESGLSPATPYPPNSVQRLTTVQMTGVTFLPNAKREEALTEKSGVNIRVVSSGWKYKDIVISQPVFQEIDEI